MADTKGYGCGIYPFIFRGWMLPACEWHDTAYQEGSWAQGLLTRKHVDLAFYGQLLELAGDNRLKQLAAWGAYRIVRAAGWLWWEGKVLRA